METELAVALEAMPADSARRIRTALAFHGLNQADFAKALGFSESTVSKWLNGARPWSETERSRVAAILGVAEPLLFPEPVNQ